MKSLSLFSPAKINLFLKVKARRPDGFHELSSLFQSLSLGDTLDFELQEGAELSMTCTDPTLPVDQSNLALQAAIQFRNALGTSFGLRLHLTKRIPAEAGLGGGSGNAATVLWGLNELHGRPLSLGELSSLGATIGSDVPFFFSTGTALGEGRGELITSLAPLLEQDLVLVKPSFGLSTAQVYGEFCLNDCAGQGTEEALAAFKSGKFPCFNDLEPAALRLAPHLASTKKVLEGLSDGPVMMSGSGTAFFCLGQRDLDIPPGCMSFPCTFLHRSQGEWYSSKRKGRPEGSYASGSRQNLPTECGLSR